jgi:hypothetical protein
LEQFIELNRTFTLIPKVNSQVNKNDEVYNPALLRYGEKFLWTKVLNENRVIILAEAGAGKTKEIRNATQRLIVDGKPAFFLRLEHIVHDLESAFEIGEYGQFQNWLSSNTEGWILLDSVDEARLKDPKDFERAIRVLAKKVSPAIFRSHVIITSRVTAWRPQTDLELCNKLFPPVKKSEKAEVESPSEIKSHENIPSNTKTSEEKEDERNGGFKVYALTDLSKEQIKIFVKAKGLIDERNFLGEIERHDAWMFTTRPQDLEEVVEFWIERKQIGTRLELIEHSIERRIRERGQDRASANPITLDKTSEGVQRLAAACTFLDTPTIRVPDGSNSSEGIDTKSILTDWNDQECEALLTRPIFDEAIYGCVRFHHRSVREYLTAKWLSNKLKADASRKKIENLFFQEQYGLKVVTPSMRPILSWLVLFDSKIMQKVYKLEPEIILEGGDPSRLPLENKKEILQKVCESIFHGSLNWTFRDDLSIRRFVTSDLAIDIRSLLEKYKNNEHVISYLLSMILQGRIKELLPEVKSLALNEKIEKHNRIISFRIVKENGSKEDYKDILKVVQMEKEPHDRGILAELIFNINSTEETVDWLLNALTKVQKNEEYAVDSLSHVITDYIKRSSPDIAFRLLKGIDPLLRLKPVIRHLESEVSQEYGWLIQFSVRVVEKLISDKHQLAFSPEVMFILLHLPTFQIYGDFEGTQMSKEIINTISNWKEFNHSLFWYDVEQTRDDLEKEQKPLTDLFQLKPWETFWKFDATDFEQILSDISNRTLQDDRLVALSLAFYLYIKNGRSKKWRVVLKSIVSIEESLKKRLHEFLNPPPSSDEVKKYKRNEAQWQRNQKNREKKRSEEHLKNFEYLNVNVEKLRNNSLQKGQISKTQFFLYSRMHEKNKNANAKWTAGNWQDLIDDYGENVAKAIRDGLVGFWRSYIPILHSEKNDVQLKENSVPYAVLFGLSGLEIELAEGCDKLSREDAGIACRYAFLELNGFPNWFYQLYKKFPDVVLDLVYNEIKWELKTNESKYYILSKTSWSAEWMHNDLALKLKMLLENEPVNGNKLEDTLKIIQKSSSISDNELFVLAERKTKECTILSNQIIWLACWIGVRPESAISYLINYLKELNAKDSLAAKDFAMKIIVQIVGERIGKTDIRESYKSPEHLKRLYLLMHEYIIIEEDIDRSGRGTYSPGLRDSSQEARDVLFSMLKEIPGKESFLAMLELSNINLVPHQQLWMRKCAKERAEMDSENSDWTENKFVEFNRTLESIPSNHKELFELAILRLEDLKYQLEEGDDSIASTLRKEDKETGIRKVIANWCREKASGKYVITQEEELADAKKPDCRFLSHVFDGPVPMELKLADNWSGNALFERLENQLNNDYLRDPRSNRGIFVLVYRGDKHKWEVNNRVDQVTFQELVDLLQDHWESIQSNYSKVEKIKVIGIDLTKREKETHSLQKLIL